MPSTYKTRPARATDLAHLPDVERSAGTLFRTVERLEAIADGDPMSVEMLHRMLEKGKVWVAIHVENENAMHRDRSTTEADRGVHNGLERMHDVATTDTNESPQLVAEGEESIVGFLAAFPLTSPQVQSQDVPQSQFLHIAELSIHASHQRRGLARRLMKDLIRHAEQLNATSSMSSPRQARINALTLTTYHTVPFNGPFYAKMGFNAIPVGEISALFGAEARQIWDEEQASLPMPEGRAWMTFGFDELNECEARAKG